MGEQTNRPRFNVVTAFIAALGLKAMQAKKAKESGEDTGADPNEFRYAGLGKFNGAPIYSPRRTKLKGYMRDKQYKAKRS